ncbi:hypothetical protein KHA94_24740 [Bacillus sp. FJAT-49705]|uniref:Glycerophosphoryl diester phosphodiesterase membrane domain-containing protein n=1 Tax=Cytobacillus citreus TaxID=2833586 RepID=A0ABS5P094_9BACI|nr:hypothetical protein [Cytobacillus citreus]MBS4193296.1 hypothetical protein [Cytobacillus citreus]
MKRILSNSIYLYSSKFVPLICLSLITYVPLLFLHTVIVNFIYRQSSFMEYPGVVGDAANGIFMLVFLTIAQVPFIKLTILDHEDEESIFKKSLGFSMDRMVSMYVFACLYALFVFFGGLLFVIPGLIILLLFYFVPYFIADGVKSYKAAIRKSVSLVKKRFLITLVIIGAITAIQLLFENVLFIFISFYTDTYFVFLFTKIVLQMFILPFQVILVTNMFNDIKIDKTHEVPTHSLLKS